MERKFREVSCSNFNGILELWRGRKTGPDHLMRRHVIRGLTLGVLLAFSLHAVHTPAQTVSEEAVKAAFLFRFADYVQWPTSGSPPAVFTIAVVDDEPVAAALTPLLATHLVEGHPAQVRRVHQAEEALDAQIVFLGGGDPDAHRRFIARLADRPALIVTEEGNGLDEGSTVNFLLVDHRLRFEVSLAAARRSHLQISSELLSVATRVAGPGAP